MPWKETSVMEERLLQISQVLVTIIGVDRLTAAVICRKSRSSAGVAQWQSSSFPS